MKKRIVVIGLLLSVLVVSTPAQVQWQFADGPYYVNFDDFTIGLQGGQVVLYAADSVEVESASGALVLKSTDRGQTWQKLYLPDPGVVRCVATVRDNPNIVYAAILGAGVYKSTNGGVSDWVRLPNQPRNLFVTRIAIDPTNSDVVWVGCQMTASLPVLYRSVDGGGSWEAFEPNPHRFPVTLSVSDIVVAGDTVFVSTYGGTGQNEGVWRTRNGGTSWTRELTGTLSLALVKVGY